MDHDGIVAHGFLYEIGAGAADVANLTDILPVLNDAHLTAHVAFFDHFIEDIYIAQSVLGLCLIVDGVHDGDRSLFCDLGIDLFVGQDAAEDCVLFFLFSLLFSFLSSGRCGGLCGSCLCRLGRSDPGAAGT